jgi:type IV pilus assembly protein PilC
MSTEASILLVCGALTYALVGLSAFLILIGRRAGWFGIAAAILGTIYPILAYLVLTGVVADLETNPRTGVAPTVDEMFAAVFGRLVPLIPVLMIPLGVLVYAYRRYRQGRQEEVFELIATAVESNVPLAPAIRAYLLDRPREGRAAWDAGLMLACPPGYVVWTQRRTFDDRVARLSGLLAAGAPLPAALRIVRGVAPREVTVAAEVGDTTGRLAVCLRRADRDRLAGAWLEVMPRILYPLILFLFIGLVTAFLTLAIVPKFKRIFDDFKEPLPPLSAWLFNTLDTIGDYVGVIILGLMGIMGLVAVVVFSPTVRWHLPIVGRLFRWEAQGLVLRMLGTLFEVGRPAPEALGLLAGAPDLPGVVRRRLEKAQLCVARGQPLADALRSTGLMPATMAPLVIAAERTHALPFALSELGDLLAGKGVRLARRTSLVIAPVLVVAIGLLVGVIVVGLFSPLVELLTRMTV